MGDIFWEQAGRGTRPRLRGGAQIKQRPPPKTWYTYIESESGMWTDLMRTKDFRSWLKTVQEPTLSGDQLVKKYQEEIVENSPEYKQFVQSNPYKFKEDLLKEYTLGLGTADEEVVVGVDVKGNAEEVEDEQVFVPGDSLEKTDGDDGSVTIGVPTSGPGPTIDLPPNQRPRDDPRTSGGRTSVNDEKVANTPFPGNADQVEGDVDEVELQEDPEEEEGFYVEGDTERGEGFSATTSQAQKDAAEAAAREAESQAFENEEEYSVNDKGKNPFPDEVVFVPGDQDAGGRTSINPDAPSFERDVMQITPIDSGDFTPDRIDENEFKGVDLYKEIGSLNKIGSTTTFGLDMMLNRDWTTYATGVALGVVGGSYSDKNHGSHARAMATQLLVGAFLDIGARLDFFSSSLAKGFSHGIYGSKLISGTKAFATTVRDRVARVPGLSDYIPDRVNDLFSRVFSGLKSQETSIVAETNILGMMSIWRDQAFDVSRPIQYRATNFILPWIEMMTPSGWYSMQTTTDYNNVRVVYQRQQESAPGFIKPRPEYRDISLIHRASTDERSQYPYGKLNIRQVVAARQAKSMNYLDIVRHIYRDLFPASGPAPPPPINAEFTMLMMDRVYRVLRTVPDAWSTPRIYEGLPTPSQLDDILQSENSIRDYLSGAGAGRGVIDKNYNPAVNQNKLHSVFRIVDRVMRDAYMRRTINYGSDGGVEPETYTSVKAVQAVTNAFIKELAKGFTPSPGESLLDRSRRLSTFKNPNIQALMRERGSGGSLQIPRRLDETDIAYATRVGNWMNILLAGIGVNMLDLGGVVGGLALSSAVRGGGRGSRNKRIPDEREIQYSSLIAAGHAFLVSGNKNSVTLIREQYENMIREEYGIPQTSESVIKSAEANNVLIHACNSTSTMMRMIESTRRILMEGSSVMMQMGNALVDEVNKPLRAILNRHYGEMYTDMFFNNAYIGVLGGLGESVKAALNTYNVPMHLHSFLWPFVFKMFSREPTMSDEVLPQRPPLKIMGFCKIRKRKPISLTMQAPQYFDSEEKEMWGDL